MKHPDRPISEAVMLMTHNTAANKENFMHCTTTMKVVVQGRSTLFVCKLNSTYGCIFGWTTRLTDNSDNRTTVRIARAAQTESFRSRRLRSRFSKTDFRSRKFSCKQVTVLRIHGLSERATMLYAMHTQQQPTLQL